MHALGSWCERYRSGTGARQSDRSSLWIKTRSALRLHFARSLHAPLRSHALVRVDPKDLEAVQSLMSRTPQTVGDVRRLLGFLSYYRTFIPEVSLYKAEETHRTCLSTYG